MEEEYPNLLSRRSFIASASSLAAATMGLTAAAAEKGPPKPPPAGRLKGKVAAVTGAARGIGRAIAVALAQEGADIVAIDIAGPVSPVLEYPPAGKGDLAETERVVAELKRRCVPVVADVRDVAALRKAAALAEKEFDFVNVVVANAGIQAFKPLREMDDRHWQDVIDVNLTGVANTIRAFVPRMIDRGSGRIIVVASSQGRVGTKHAASYSASKWGVIGLAKSAALELGEHGITVNTIIPGLVDTPMTRNMTRWREAVAEVEKHPPVEPTERQAAEASRRKCPLGVPWLQPEDVAPAAVFLASDDGRMASGAEYDVTAGFSAHYTA